MAIKYGVTECGHRVRHIVSGQVREVRGRFGDYYDADLSLCGRIVIDGSGWVYLRVCWRCARKEAAGG